MASPSTAQIRLTPSPPSSIRGTYAAISGLPYDAIFELSRHLDAQDVVQLLSTCHSLRAYYFEDSLWGHFCRRFGLFDTKYFGGRSSFAIYSTLLHTYGPLVGLWAGDHPFTGNILEFLIDPGNEAQQGGILGEVWQFRPVQPEDADFGGLQMPERPIRYRVIRIGFDTSTDDCHIRIFCCGSFHSSDSGTNPEVWHQGILKVVSRTEQSIFLHTRLGPFAHPDFPGKHFLYPASPNANADSWYNKLRTFPRLQEEVQIAVDQSFLSTRIAHPRIPIVLATRASHTSPKAITIDCNNHCMQMNAPFLGFENFIPSLPRYYPVHTDVIAGIHPMSNEWSPRSLVGLWLGALGSHGTECIYLDWHEASSRIMACKVTGDENVPRGALSWSLLTTSPYVAEEDQRQLLEQSFGPLHRCRLFHGEAIASERGYMPHHRTVISAMCAVVGPNEIRISFPSIPLTSAFIRYQRQYLP